MPARLWQRRRVFTPEVNLRRHGVSFQRYEWLPESGCAGPLGDGLKNGALARTPLLIDYFAYFSHPGKLIQGSRACPTRMFFGQFFDSRYFRE